MDKNDLIKVPRWALQLVLDEANLNDSGPPGEGWRSEEMDKAVAVLAVAVEAEAE